jgi:prevent-host-death family protein
MGRKMLTVKENTTLVGVSELRSGIDKILEKARKGLVIIEKRHKPQAVLMSNEEYESITAMLDLAEDLVLGFIAKERLENCQESDYVDIESLLA